MLKLQQEQRRVKGILASMVDAVLVVDTQARISLAKKPAEDVCLVSEGDLEGKRLEDINCDEEICSMIHQVLTTGKEV